MARPPRRNPPAPIRSKTNVRGSLKKLIPPRYVEKRDPVYMGVEQELKDIQKKIGQILGTPSTRREATKERTSVRRRADRTQRGTTSGTGPRAAARRAAQKRRARPTSPTKPNKRPRG